MKKILPLLLITCFCLFRSQAQETYSRWSIGLSAGPSFPTGKFASKNSQTWGSGHALTGVGADLTAGYRLNRAFGLVFMAGWQENKMQDANEINTDYGNNYPHAWKITWLLTGISYSHPFSMRGAPTLQIRVLGGLLKTSIPGVIGGFSYSEAPAALPWTFSYQADAGLKWKLSSRFSLMTAAGYAGSSPIKHAVIFGATALPYTIHYHYFFGFAMLRAGIEMRL